MQLHQTIDAFSSALSYEIDNISNGDCDWGILTSYFTPMAICYSARITLYDAYMCPDADNFKGVGIPEQIEMQQIAISSIRESCMAVYRLAAMINKTVDLERLPIMTPLLTDCLYQASMLIGSYVRESGHVEYSYMETDIICALKTLAGSWHVSSTTFTFRTKHCLTVIQMNILLLLPPRIVAHILNRLPLLHTKGRDKPATICVSRINLPCFTNGGLSATSGCRWLKRI